MEISVRDLLTALHGVGFGALFMMAFSGAIGELHGAWSSSSQANPDQRGQTMLRIYLVGMVALAWLTVVSGAYIVYPWYRAVPPPGFTDLSAYPQRFLMSSPNTVGWHSLGMEWKEHIAWIAPITMTMVAYVYWRYGRSVNKHPGMRNVVLIFTTVAFLATGVAGVFGVFINKYAPVRGGTTIQLMQGE